MTRYNCKQCIYSTSCKDIHLQGACKAFFPRKVDDFTSYMHQLKEFPLEDLLLAKVLTDRVLSLKLQEIKLDLKLGDKVSFMYREKEVQALLTAVNGGIIVVDYKGEHIRLLKSDVIIKGD